MPSTTEATRDELFAEYVVRDALSLVENNILGALHPFDPDVVEQLAPVAGGSDGLRVDDRLNELFELFVPDGREESPEALRSSAESCRLAARILRAIVYDADSLRDAAVRLVRIGEEHAAKAEASGDA